jgi:two-component system, chemotaxis family, chemotaxis protein CheY
MQALVVDDSRVLRMQMKQILQEAGFVVAEASNGREGLEWLRRLGPVELALVDWNMPVMNGLEFVRTLRGDPVYQNQRLIMVTTEADEDYRQAALAVGVDAYILKPLTAEVIVENIRRLGL